MKQYEVRCCCEPGVLLGHLELPDNLRPGFVRVAPVLQPFDVPTGHRTRPVRGVLVEMAQFVDEDGAQCLAVKAPHDMDLLGRVRGFTPTGAYNMRFKYRCFRCGFGLARKDQHCPQCKTGN